MKSNHLKQTGTFTMALIMMFFVSVSSIVVGSLAMPDTAWARTPKEIAKEECAKEGGEWTEDKDGYSCKFPDGGTQDCTTGDYNICLWCFGGESRDSCMYLSKGSGLMTPSAIRARASSMKKIPLTSIPVSRIHSPRLRAIRANLIRKNKQRKALPRYKVKPKVRRQTPKTDFGIRQKSPGLAAPFIPGGAVTQKRGQTKNQKKTKKTSPTQKKNMHDTLKAVIQN